MAGWPEGRGAKREEGRGTGRRRPKPPAEDEENHPWAVTGIWPSVEPSAASAIAPDRYRGCGQNLPAHIRAQKEPVVSPVGTGDEHHRPRRVSARLRYERQGNPSGSDVDSRISEPQCAALQENTFIIPATGRERHAIAEGWGMLGDASRGCEAMSGRGWKRHDGRTCSGGLTLRRPLARRGTLVIGFDRDSALALGIARA